MAAPGMERHGRSASDHAPRMERHGRSATDHAPRMERHGRWARSVKVAMSNRSRPLARLASIALCAVVLASCQFLGGAPSRTYPPTTVRSVAIPSKLLNGDRHALVYVPGARAAGDPAEPLPLLLVFHGFGADESSWFGARADDALHLDG